MMSVLYRQRKRLSMETHQWEQKEENVVQNELEHDVTSASVQRTWCAAIPVLHLHDNSVFFSAGKIGMLAGDHVDHVRRPHVQV